MVTFTNLLERKNYHRPKNKRSLSVADTGFLPGVGAHCPVMDWYLNAIE